ncbi:EVI5-like protein [Tanacetum coccineum]
MEKKRVDESVQLPAQLRLDRFGFVKPEHDLPDHRLTKSKSAFEYQRWLTGRREEANGNGGKRIGVGVLFGNYIWKPESFADEPHVFTASFSEKVSNMVSSTAGMICTVTLAVIYMSEEDAFWLLVALLKGAVHAPMEGLYLEGLPLVQQYLFQFDLLMRDYMPKLGEHFTQEMINPSMVSRLSLKDGLGSAKYCHDDLAKLPFEKLIHALRNFPDDAMNPDKLLPLAYSFKFQKSINIRVILTMFARKALILVDTVTVLVCRAMSYGSKHHPIEYLTLIHRH